jgi:hypothetical protein
MKKKLPFWKTKEEEKTKKLFQISGCNDVKNSSHLYTYCVLLITYYIIIIIIDYFTKEKTISIFFRVKLNIQFFNT